jgi:hypothetical protein
MGLRSLACWDCAFESCGGHGCLPLDSVVCYLVQGSATGQPLFRRIITECSVSEFDQAQK